MPELAGYEFIRPLGEGAMGPVHLARRTSDGAEVAVKQILGLWNGDREVLARFQREADALERLDHPNIARIHELAIDGADLFLVTEYVPGPSLRRLMDRAPLTKPEAMSVISDVAAALDYAGSMSMIHGDLKPANVFVTASGLSKVADFGLVRMLSRPASPDSEPGPILGTPAYISPEQAAGHPGVDPRSDLYSLAVMAYEMLVGQLPFPSVPGDAEASLDAHISAPVPRPVSLVLGFPMQAQEVLLQGLAKGPSDRLASAGKFWEALSAAGNIAWPGWAGESDLATIASAAAPPAPTMAEPVGAAVAEPIAEPVLAAPVAEAPVAARLAPADAAPLDMEVYEPLEAEEPERRGRTRWLALALLLLLVGAVAAGIAVTQLQVFGGGTPLVVSAVSVTANPATGHCPSSRYFFTARVVNNGQGGPVTYKWVKPDQQETEPTTATIPSGQKEAVATLEFTFQGQVSTEGDAILHITLPNDIKSGPTHITYRCP